MGAERTARGVTFFELLATVALLMILASAVLPVARLAHKRQKEIELRRALRTIRTAIDRYHDSAKPQAGGPPLCPPKLGTEGYPPDLEDLVKGCDAVGSPGKKLKFLRKIPVDPMTPIDPTTGKTEWGLRCVQDEPDANFWCGNHVWDVYTKSEGKAIDGTLYKEW